jgi:hypothetical protein
VSVYYVTELTVCNVVFVRPEYDLRKSGKDKLKRKFQYKRKKKQEEAGENCILRGFMCSTPQQVLLG